MTEKTLRVLSHFPTAGFEPVRAEFPHVEFIQVPPEGALGDEVQGEVLLTNAWGGPNVRELMSRGVLWIHTFGTGVDRFPLDAVGDRILTCARGASGVPIAEWILAMMLAFEKNLPDSWVTTPPENWNRAQLGGLRGKTLGLVGLGGIGTAVAERALPFGMVVRAIRRTATPSPLPQVELAPDLGDLAASADHLVIVAPATPATRQLIGRAVFEKVKSGVHLVNVARGTLVDHDALREALDDGRVARASLDVTDPEPLPAGHWLFDHRRVRVSPHISWSMPGAIPELFSSFVANLRRYVAGEPLEGRVDVEAGY